MRIVPRQLGSLGASWDNPLRPEELPSGILFIYPRYVLKILDDLLSGDISLQQCEEWARNPPDWVKKKNKLGQDSYRLACFIRHRLNHRIPKNWFDSQIDSDAALVIEGRWKYNDLSMQTLAEWSVAPPNWKPWNRNKDLTAVVMPAILWARKVASARAGVDIPFFVDSTIEELADTIITSNQTTKLLLGALETACNAIATAGTAEIVKEGVKAGTKEAVKEGVKQTVTEQLTDKAVTYGTAQAKAEARKQAGKLVSAISKEQSSRKGQEAALALGTGAIAGGVAFLAATPPVGWIAIGVIAFTPILCWGAKEAALKLVMSNLRDWFPDFVPTFIGSVYEQRFGIVPGADVIANLDQRYSGLISANSIAKAVASSENDPAVIAAVSKKQTEIQDSVRKALANAGCKDSNPDRVAAFADRAFNNFWDAAEINRRVFNEKSWLCSVGSIREVRSIIARPAISRDAARFTAAVSKIRGPLPKPPPPTIARKMPVLPPRGDITLPPPLPPTAPAPKGGGIGPALALAAGGFFVGGPPGAGVGFVLGLVAGKKK